MSFVVRDPRFSMSMTEAEIPRRSATPYPRVSRTKQLERRLIGMWKIVTRSARKQPRNSFISPDFIVITSRRRSTYHPQMYRY